MFFISWKYLQESLSRQQQTEADFCKKNVLNIRNRLIINAYVHQKLQINIIYLIHHFKNYQNFKNIFLQWNDVTVTLNPSQGNFIMDTQHIG